MTKQHDASWRPRGYYDSWEGRAELGLPMITCEGCGGTFGYITHDAFCGPCQRAHDAQAAAFDAYVQSERARGVTGDITMVTSGKETYGDRRGQILSEDE